MDWKRDLPSAGRIPIPADGAAMKVLKMNTLNRYILGKFLGPFFASFGALCVLLLVSQIFERLDKFLADGVGWKHVVGYLAAAMPLQAVQILPVACLLATLFVVGSLARTKEYIAGLAGGLAPEKFLGGIFLAGLVISIACLIANETFVPITTRYSTQVFRQEIRRISDWTNTISKNIVVAGADGRLWTAVIFDRSAGEMTTVIVDTFDGARVSEQINAASAQRVPEGWFFKNGAFRKFAEDGATIESVEPFTERTFAFREQPDDLVTQEPEPEEMNFKTLRRHIDKLSALGVPVRELEVELMMKLSLPFTCFVVTFLGVPLAMSGKGSRAMGIGAGGALTLVYLGFIQFGKALAQRFIAPWAGAWLGNIVFLSIALYLWWRMRRVA